MLNDIKFLKFKNLIYDDIICSFIFLNDDDEIKINMQKRCTIMSKKIKKKYLNVQIVENIIKQLLKKHKKIATNDLRR